MGALFSGSCYASAADAGAAFFSASAPVITGADAVSQFEYRTDAWYLVGYTSGVETSSYAAATPDFAACTVGESAADGLVIGGLVVLVWAMGFWGRSLRNAGHI